MPRKRLTEQNVISLPTKRTAYRVWDAGSDKVNGLHVLVQKSGTRSYRVNYRFPGSPKEQVVQLGRVGEITLSAARSKALDIRRTAAAGADPKATEASDTFKTCVETWTTNEQVGRKECVSADRTQIFLLSACERWHDRQIATLRYSEIDDLLCAYRKRSPYSANRIHAHLKTLFRWAVRTKRLAVSPMAEMPRPWLGAKARTRSWFEGEKADEVLSQLWQCADQLGGSRGKFIKLLVITGKRRTAIETMRWEHIDQAWYWRPTLGTKRKRCHAIPLPKLAQRVLSPREGRDRVLGPFDAQALVRNVRSMTGIEDFIWHGVRHIMATKLRQLRVSPYVARLVLDHVAFSDAHSGYEHSDHRAEMLEALELWCSHVESLVQPADTVRVLR